VQLQIICKSYFVKIYFRSQLSDFTEPKLRVLKRVYSRVFTRSQLRFATGSGLNMSDIFDQNSLTGKNNADCENIDKVNVFLLPDFDLENDSNKISNKLSFDHFVKILKRKVFSIQPRPLSTLAKQTEKTWLFSAQKCWDSVKNCQHYHEYNRLATI
jgi:hypothetical protein